MNLLLRTGQILVDSSADTSRIVRNMHRAAAFLGFKTEYIHIYVDYYMLTVSFSDEHHSFVQMRRCYKHGIDMAAIQDISKLTWRALRRDYSLDDYENALNWVGTRKRTYSDWAVAICAGFACGGFCIQFGCDWTAFFYASIAAILGNRLKMWLNAQGSNNYFDIAVAAFVSTIIAWLSTFISVPGNAVNAFVSSTPWLSFLLSSTPWHPLMACALFIVPGVPLINFVSDMLDNHIETGLVRATNTLLMIVAMSFGIAVAIKFCGIDNFVRTLSMTPHHTFIEYGIAAAISAMGFATIFNTPLRLQPWIACGGIIAVCFRNFVNLGPSSGNIGLDYGPIIGTLCGSALISIINIKMCHVIRTPHQCITIPAVIPMVPGVLMYRALYGFIDMQGVVGEVTFATSNAIKGSLILIMIAVGVDIPNVFMRKWVSMKHQKRLVNMVQNRERCGKFVDIDKVE
jgi:uncharacterized membrane protein YjjP (DUF1212 family)